MDSTVLIYFLGASIALTVAPGPDNLFIISQGVTRGRRTAVVTALGMCSGISVHTVAAACGISALFYSSATAFNLVKYAGACYLLFLAWRSLRERSALQLSATDTSPDSLMFRRGFIMNVLNPKVAMFFLAFLPQFVSPGSGRVPVQMLVLGGMFMLQALVIFCLIGWFSGYMGSWLLSRSGLGRHFHWLSAGVFLALGFRLALATR